VPAEAADDPMREVRVTRFLIAGAGGMLGTAMQRVLAERGIPCVAPPEAEFNILNEDQVKARAAEFAETLDPGERGVILNAAAYTNVERAEEERNTAHAVNALAPVYVAFAARENRLALVHVSTDFVFDGTKNGPYAEDDEPNPVSWYGLTKLTGERMVREAFEGAEEQPLIVRTAWVFGPNGANFPSKILQVARERGSVAVVTDEIGSPTYTLDLARGILGLVEADASGTFHLAGSGSCSRYEMALEILRLAGLGDVSVEAVTSDSFPTKAARPKNSVLDCSKARALGVEMPLWTDALERFLLHDVAT
jgi:dTDP-4-dehydrorhamnose reductase